MSRRYARPKLIGDPRQLELFDELDRPDPLVIFYQKLRKAGAWLTYDIEERRLLAGHDHDVLGRWVIRAMQLLRDRIVADLLRVEHGIEPPAERENLAGGAQLVRLPTRRPPDQEPPVRQRTPASDRRGPGAA